MYRISLIISEIYNKYAPLAEKNQVQLNLDLGDNTETVDDVDEIRQDLEKHLSSALERSDSGSKLSISLKKHEIVVTDSGTILSKAVCDLLSQGRVKVRSRVGFGTSVSISLEKSKDNSSNP